MEDFTFWFYGKRKLFACPRMLQLEMMRAQRQRSFLCPIFLHPPPADIPHGKTERGFGGGGPFRGGSAPGFGSPVSLSLHIPAPLTRRCLAVRRGMCCSVRLLQGNLQTSARPVFRFFLTDGEILFFIVPSCTCRPSFPAASLFFANTSTPSTG